MAASFVIQIKLTYRLCIRLLNVECYVVQYGDVIVVFKDMVMDMGKYAKLFEHEPSTITEATDLYNEQPHLLKVCQDTVFLASLRRNTYLNVQKGSHFKKQILKYH